MSKEEANHSLRVSQEAYDALRKLHAHLLEHGAKAAPPWLRDKLLKAGHITLSGLLESCVLHAAEVANPATNEEAEKL